VASSTLARWRERIPQASHAPRNLVDAVGTHRDGARVRAEPFEAASEYDF
jgi:hypothetical protein